MVLISCFGGKPFCLPCFLKKMKLSKCIKIVEEDIDNDDFCKKCYRNKETTLDMLNRFNQQVSISLKRRVSNVCQINPRSSRRESYCEKYTPKPKLSGLSVSRSDSVQNAHVLSVENQKMLAKRDLEHNKNKGQSLKKNNTGWFNSVNQTLLSTFEIFSQ